MLLKLKKKKDVKIKFTEISLAEILFLIFWVLLMIGKGLGYVGNDRNFKIILLIAIPFFGLKIMLTRWKRMQLFRCMILFLLGCIQLFFSGDVTFFLTIVTLIAMKNIDVYRLLKCTLYIRMIMFLVRSTLAILGVIEMGYSYRYVEGNVTTRMSLGFGMPNSTHYFLFSIVVLIIIVYQGQIELGHYVIMFLYNYFVYTYTDSRSGFFMTTAVIGLSYFMDKNIIKNLNSLIWKIGSKIYIILALISIAIPIIILKIPYLANLGTFSARFLSAIKIMNNNEISLFGDFGIITDFGFVNILYTNGIIIFILFIIANTALMSMLNKNKLYYEELVLCSYAVYTLMEAYTLSVLMNMSLLWLVFVLYPETNALRRYKECVLKY